MKKKGQGGKLRAFVREHPASLLLVCVGSYLAMIGCLQLLENGILPNECGILLFPMMLLVPVSMIAAAVLQTKKRKRQGVTSPEQKRPEQTKLPAGYNDLVRNYLAKVLYTPVKREGAEVKTRLVVKLDDAMGNWLVLFTAPDRAAKVLGPMCETAPVRLKKKCREIRKDEGVVGVVIDPGADQIKLYKEDILSG